MQGKRREDYCLRDRPSEFRYPDQLLAVQSPVRQREVCGSEKESMPSAHCWACLTGVASVPIRSGTVGDPLGSCRNCQAFACHGHGHRDPTIPEFICVECDPSLLAASAGAQLRPDNPAQAPLVAGYRPPQILIPGGVTIVFLVEWIVRGPEDFFRRRPGYPTNLLEHLPNRRFNLDQPWENDQLRRALTDVPRTVTQLALLAAVMAEFLGLSPERLTAALRDLRRNLI